MATREEIYNEVISALTELFGASVQKLSPATRLVEDLDLDSIDAIEMSVRLEERVGYEFKGPELRAIRTLQDIVELVYARQSGAAEAEVAVAAAPRK